MHLVDIDLDRTLASPANDRKGLNVGQEDRGIDEFAARIRRRLIVHPTANARFEVVVGQRWHRSVRVNFLPARESGAPLRKRVVRC
jgi:hypothetical protein